MIDKNFTLQRIIESSQKMGKAMKQNMTVT